MNQHKRFQQLRHHWAYSAVMLLSETLYELDVMGLAENMCPENEYEPEALRGMACVCGGDIDKLLAMDRPPAAPVNAKALTEAVIESFEVLFGSCPSWSESQKKRLERAAQEALSDLFGVQ
jgi:hypothetical protein